VKVKRPLKATSEVKFDEQILNSHTFFWLPSLLVTSLSTSIASEAMIVVSLWELCLPYGEVEMRLWC
jgi:hypothetical protein